MEGGLLHAGTEGEQAATPRRGGIKVNALTYTEIAQMLAEGVVELHHIGQLAGRLRGLHSPRKEKEVRGGEIVKEAFTSDESLEAYKRRKKSRS